MSQSARFVVPCNWQDDLLEQLDPAEVDSLYGKLPEDVLGGGRPTCKLPRTSLQEAEAFIAKVRDKGIHFNYLVNSSCTANAEFTESGHQEILELLDWVAQSGADFVTVATPFVADLVARRHDRLKIAVSKFGFVASPQQARFWQDAGAFQITIDPRITRCFSRLEAIRAAVQIQMVMLVNEACLLGCPHVYYHANCDSHGSQKGERQAYASYSRLFCARVYAEHADQIIKATFIRPEDLSHYESIGIDRFKLVGRVRPTWWITRALEAYKSRRFEGNLAELMGTFSTYTESPGARQPASLDVDQIDGHVELERLRKSEAMRQEITIDNRALDDYLDPFRRIDCETTPCEECGYCERLAARAVRYGRGCDLQTENLRQAASWVLDGRLCGK